MTKLDVKMVRPIDIVQPQHLEVLVREDGKTMWINADGICVFRACGVGTLRVNDHRKKQAIATKSGIIRKPKGSIVGLTKRTRAELVNIAGDALRRLAALEEKKDGA